MKVIKLATFLASGAKAVKFATDEESFLAQIAKATFPAFFRVFQVNDVLFADFLVLNHEFHGDLLFLRPFLAYEEYFSKTYTRLDCLKNALVYAFLSSNVPCLGQKAFCNPATVMFSATLAWHMRCFKERLQKRENRMKTQYISKQLMSRTGWDKLLMSLFLFNFFGIASFWLLYWGAGPIRGFPENMIGTLLAESITALFCLATFVLDLRNSARVDIMRVVTSGMLTFASLQAIVDSVLTESYVATVILGLNIIAATGLLVANLRPRRKHELAAPNAPLPFPTRSSA